jgi:hypothetical protein
MFQNCNYNVLIFELKILKTYPNVDISICCLSGFALFLALSAHQLVIHYIINYLSIIVRWLIVLFFFFFQVMLLNMFSLTWYFLSKWHAWIEIIYNWLIHTLMIRHGSLHKTSKSEVDDWGLKGRYLCSKIFSDWFLFREHLDRWKKST